MEVVGNLKRFPKPPQMPSEGYRLNETLDKFFERDYMNFVGDVVLVYPYRIGEGDAQIWTMEQTGEYVKYLQAKERDEVMI